MFQKCKLRLAKALGTICATTTVKEVKIKIKVSVHETEVGRQLLNCVVELRFYSFEKSLQSF